MESSTGALKLIKYAVLGVVVLIIFFGSFSIVSPQEIGVVTRAGSLNRIINEGWNWKIPLLEGVTKMNIAEQKVEYPTQAYSRDGQVIDLAVTANYQINQVSAEQVYRETKNDYQNIYLSPVITPSSEEVVSRYTAQELVDKKAEWSAEVKRLIIERIGQRGLTVKSIEITKFDFDDGYEASIRSKQIAEQKALEQVNVTKQEEEKKKQEILKAEALAEKTRLEAQALASQQGNKITEKILAEAALAAANKWNGVLPTTMVPNGALPFIDVNVK